MLHDEAEWALQPLCRINKVALYDGFRALGVLITVQQLITKLE